MEITILVVLVLAIIRGEYNRANHISWARSYKETMDRKFEVDLKKYSEWNDALWKKYHELKEDIDGQTISPVGGSGGGQGYNGAGSRVYGITRNNTGEVIQAGTVIIRKVGLKELMEKISKEQVENSIEIRKRFGEMDSFIKLLKANLPPEVFDFTKKTRGWKAEWKITAKDKKDIETMDGTQEEIAEIYKISRERVGQIKRAYRLRMGIKTKR